MISIITTVRNGENYISEMLDSVNNQTFRQFEHIVVDDGSTDKTLHVLSKYKAQNPDFKLDVYTSGHLGRGVALNFAISKANYDWIAVIDADDIWHPKKLEIQYDIIQRCSVDVLATASLVFSSFTDINFNDLRGFPEITYYNLRDLLKSNMLSHSSVIIRKNLCVYDEKRKSQFDYDLWLRLAQKDFVLAKCSLPLNYHRIHSNQTYEAKMKKIYRWRAYKMKASIAWKTKDYYSLLYGTGKLLFDFVFPRKVRFKIKDILSK